MFSGQTRPGQQMLDIVMNFPHNQRALGSVQFFPVLIIKGSVEYVVVCREERRFLQILFLYGHCELATTPLHGSRQCYC